MIYDHPFEYCRASWTTNEGAGVGLVINPEYFAFFHLWRQQLGLAFTGI